MIDWIVAGTHGKNRVFYGGIQFFFCLRLFNAHHDIYSARHITHHIWRITMTNAHLVSLTEVADGNVFRYAARDLARRTVAKKNSFEFIHKPDTIRFVVDQYYCTHSGNRIASSRTTPVEGFQYQYTVGQWRIDDLWGIYGRTVDMLCLLDPFRLALFEGDYTNPKIN